MKTSEDAEKPVEFLKILEKGKMKRLERRPKKKELRVMLSDRRWLRVFVPLPPSIPSPISTLCPRLLIPPIFCPPPPPFSLSLPESLVVSHPRRRSGLIIISQARPHQETWLLMREKSIPLSRPLPSLSLPQSIYPLSPLFSTPSPPTPSFLIRQIPRELEAISAAGTGVTSVCVCACVI